MMKYFCLFLVVGNFKFLHAQTSPHNNTWYFGCGHTVQFTPTGPVAGIGIPMPPPQNLYSLHSGTSEASIGVNNEQGMLQFFVQVKGIVDPSAAMAYVANKPKVFNRNGQPFANGNIEANYADGNSGNPVVVPHPGNAQQYYLFYVHNSALLYSLVDMSLNNGMGNIVASQKDVKLTGYGRIIGRKITTVKGCNQRIWLVARSKTANEYLSFAISPSGIDTQAIVSATGTGNLVQYVTINSTYWGGVVKASNSGKHIVAGTNTGIELYDFEPCSGLLKNARKIDTIGALGLCFSPDDTKLYSTQLEQEWGYVDRGKVYQYAFDATNLNATQASKTLLLENTLMYWPGWNVYTSGFIGDIKQGPDHKLYVGSNTFFYFGGMPLPVPPATTVLNQQALHVIHQPNLGGMACQPQLDYIPLLGTRTNATGLMLPQDILVAATAAADTLPGITQEVSVCFAEEAILTANPEGACYRWDEGSTGATRTVDGNGVYWVGYYTDCSYRVDTFRVNFIPLPALPQLAYACPDEGSIQIPAVDSYTVFQYKLYNSDGVLAGSAGGLGAQRFSHLASGNYTLRITSNSCDTTLPLSLMEYPKPTLVVQPVDTTMRYGDTIQLQVSGAYIYTWSPTAHLDSATHNAPQAWPPKPTRYEVVGINEYGCRDIAHINVDINYDMPEFVPNAFSPNGDGLNDVFRLAGITFHKLSVFKVFNRYGHEVYSGSDPTSGWDGNWNGNPCDVGTYYYLIGLVYPDGRLKTLKGDVMLIR